MRKQRGFTLIELLIVVAIIGIIAAIAIPNLLDAIERSRQKRSTAEIKTMATAAQSFSVDFGGYMSSNLAAAIPATLWPTIVNIGGQTVVVPDLIQKVPETDGWKTAYQYQAGVDQPTLSTDPNAMAVIAQHFCIWSEGADRANSASALDLGAAAGSAIAGQWCASPQGAALGTLQTHHYDTDIVWGDSSFLQAPEGKQSGG